MSAAEYTASARPTQEGNIPEIHRSKRLAYKVEWDDGAVVVFAKSSAAARRMGANELNCEFESVDLCRRAPEFDTFADRGFVPAEELIAAGWRFECNGCSNWVSTDTIAVDESGYEALDEDDNEIPINPIYEDHGVWCSPECKARHFEDKRIRKGMQDAAIEDFKRRVHRRFPDVEFTTGEHSKPHAYAYQRNGVYGLKQVVVYFTFPGQKIGPASYRWDLEDCYELIGPRPPVYTCCNGDREAFEALARETTKSGGAA